MAGVNFYLKKKEPTTGKSLIYLQYKYNSERLVYGFGQTIYPKDWNLNKQRVKSNNQTTEDGQSLLNELLDNLEAVCLKAYHTEIKTGVPKPATLKKYLVDFMNQKSEDAETPTLAKLVERFVNNEIKYKGRTKSANTLKTYKTFQGHLQEYERHTRTKVNFEDITLDFYHKFTTFLERKTTTHKDRRTGQLVEKTLSPNAVAKDIQILKVIMSEAVDLGYTNNLQFRSKKFAVNRKETDAVYLTERELIRLFNYDLSDKKRLEQARDLFVFGAFVGLRYSDFSAVKPENIQQDETGDYYIKLRTQKTNERVVIPCNPIVLQIFDKYAKNPNKLPRSISNQKLNDYIKETCKLAGFTAKGRLSTEPEKELWECVSSHTARRSFATNLYEQQFPAQMLMKITGHKTERAFLTYIKTTKETAARQLNEHMKGRNWGEFLLRVA